MQLPLCEQLILSIRIKKSHEGTLKKRACGSLKTGPLKYSLNHWAKNTFMAGVPEKFTIQRYKRHPFYQSKQGV